MQMHNDNIRPPMDFHEIRLDSARTVTIADDGQLPGGTKQRLLMRIMPRYPPDTELVYAGAAQGAAQPALAFAAAQYPSLRLRATIFVAESRPRSAMTVRAETLGATIREIRGDLKRVLAEAARYVAMNRRRTLLPFGLATDEYVDILSEELGIAWAGRPPPRRIWMVAGSLTLYRAYHKLFGPSTEYHIVQVGKTIWPDQLLANTTLHVSPQPFWEIADPQPPYPSVATYDAKLWRFAPEFQDGDTIVNVAADRIVSHNAVSAGNPVPMGMTLVIPDPAAARLYAGLQTGRPWRPAAAPPFPYKSYAMTAEEVTRRFLALQSYELRLRSGRAPIYNITNARPDELLYAGSATYAEVHPGDYWDYDLISDAFTETARIDCRRFDGESPHEYWSRNWREVLRTADMRRGAPATAIRDRLAILCAECTTFKPSLLVGFAKLLCGPRPRILDISSGWGDRLIGAMALDARAYYAADPNTALQSGYEAIRRAFGHLTTDPTAFVTVPVPFEELDLTDREFDLVFTSPPYWNLELYGDAAAQSTTKHAALEDWFNNFLMASLRRAAATLRVGGHLVININDAQQSASYRQEYTMRMVRELTELDYIGCLPQWVGPPSKKSAQPFWLFCKGSSVATRQ